MPDKTLLFLQAITGLHPGSGTSLGVVDLPVQRERHNDWPTIPGSAIKGVLRDACQTADRDWHSAAFGPETQNASDHAGALAFTDARLLAFPVRSLKGVFALVTCPEALGRLNRDLALAGLPVLAEMPAPGKYKAIVHPDCICLVADDKLVFEEFEFSLERKSAVAAEWMAKNAVKGGFDAKRVVVLHNDDFTHFARHATEVVARVGLNHETKTVKNGALFYEEFLPAETLLYSIVLATPSRKTGFGMDASAMLAGLKVPDVLQVGGDASIGKGLCATQLLGRP